MEGRGKHEKSRRSRHQKSRHVLSLLPRFELLFPPLFILMQREVRTSTKLKKSLKCEGWPCICRILNALATSSNTCLSYAFQNLIAQYRFLSASANHHLPLLSEERSPSKYMVSRSSPQDPVVPIRTCQYFSQRTLVKISFVGTPYLRALIHGA